MNLQILGAAGTVTGSKYRLRAGKAEVLIDCGLFQGFKALRQRNWAEPPFDPRALDAVLLTHAHIDHSGYLPLLARKGFAGPIYATPGTADLCRILLPDAAHLQEEDAERANRHGYSRHHPARPLFTLKDAKRALGLLEEVEMDTPFDPAPGLEARFIPAGHILGAASIHIKDHRHAILFSGDLGRSQDLVMGPPHPRMASDVVVVEATYGDRIHPKDDPVAELGRLVKRVVGRHGTMIVPAFAVGRTQALLLALAELKRTKRIPKDLPIYLNSPMAIEATKAYDHHRDAHRLTPAQCEAMAHAARLVTTPEASKALNEDDTPKIIIAGSGMATGGRVLHHLAAFGPGQRNMIVLAGYQAGGTRGAALQNGASELKIHGAYVPIHAEVAMMNNLSAHADQDELVQWLDSGAKAPRKCLITHGEPASAEALRIRIERDLGWTAEVAEQGQEFSFGPRQSKR